MVAWCVNLREHGEQISKTLYTFDFYLMGNKFLDHLFQLLKIRTSLAFLTVYVKAERPQIFNVLHACFWPLLEQKCVTMIIFNLAQ